MKPVYAFAAVLGIVTAIAFGLVMQSTAGHDTTCPKASAKSTETMFVPCLATADATGGLSSSDIHNPAFRTREQLNAEAWTRRGRT